MLRLRLAFPLLLCFCLACSGPDADTSAHQLGPGMARITAYVESCGGADDGSASYPCILRVERTHATGPQTPHPTAGSNLTVNVYPSHFRDLSPEELRSRLEPGRTLDLTLQQDGGGEDPPRTWRLVRF